MNTQRLLQCLRKVWDSNNIRVFILYLVSSLILLVTLIKLGTEDIVQSIKLINLRYLPIVVFLYLVYIVMGSFNFWVLVNSLKRRPLVRIMKYHLFTQAIGSLIPAKLGELYVLKLLRNEGINTGKALAIFVMDKIITLLLLVSVSIITLAIFAPFDNALLIAVVIATLFSSVVLIIYSKGTRHIIKKYLLGNLATKFHGFSKTSIQLVKKHFKNISVNFLGTLFRYIIISVATYYLFLSLGIHVNIVIITLFFITSQLLSFFPLTVNGTGLKELLLIYLYQLIDVDPVITMARSLIGLLILYAYYFILVILFRRFIQKNEAH